MYPQDYYYYYTPGCGIMDSLEGPMVSVGAYSLFDTGGVTRDVVILQTDSGIEFNRVLQSII